MDKKEGVESQKPSGGTTGESGPPGGSTESQKRPAVNWGKITEQARAEQARAEQVRLRSEQVRLRAEQVRLQAEQDRAREEQAQSQAAQAPAVQPPDYPVSELHFNFSQTFKFKGDEDHKDDLYKVMDLYMSHQADIDCSQVSSNGFQWDMYNLRVSTRRYILLVTSADATLPRQKDLQLKHLMEDHASFSFKDHASFSFKDHASNGALRRALIFRHFTTFEDYAPQLLNKPPEEMNAHLREIFAAYVEGLLSLYNCNEGPHGNRFESSMVVFGGRGALVRASVGQKEKDKKELTCSKEFHAMGKAIQLSFSAGVVPNTLPMEFCGKLFYFITMLKKVNTDRQCQWMKYSPYILSPMMKARVLIPHLSDLAHLHKNFRAALRRIDCDNWENYVKRKGPPEMKACLKFIAPQATESTEWEKNAFSFLTYVRNCESHLHSHKKPKHCDGDRLEHYSVYLREYEQMLEFVDEVFPDFLEMVFYIAVIQEDVPFVLEMIPKGGQQLRSKNKKENSGMRNKHLEDLRKAERSVQKVEYQHPSEADIDSQYPILSSVANTADVADPADLITLANSTGWQSRGKSKGKTVPSCHGHTVPSCRKES